MLNREWMTRPVHSVKPRDSIAHARALLEEERINQLPVSVDGALVGIVTDRDLRDVFPSVIETLATRKRPSHTDPEAIFVEDVMSRNVLTLGPDDALEEAARIMRQQRIGAIPIVERDRLVGIITRSDVLKAYVELYGRMHQIHAVPGARREDVPTP